MIPPFPISPGLVRFACAALLLAVAACPAFAAGGDSPAEWVNALAAGTSAFVALVALAASIISLRVQRRHNVLTLRPLPFVSLLNYEDKIAVILCNHGPGPLIVDRFKARRAGAAGWDLPTAPAAPTEVSANLIDFMPTLRPGGTWHTYSMSLRNGRTIPAGEEVAVVELRGRIGNKAFEADRDRVRQALAGLEIKLKYRDVYGNRMELGPKSLAWFAAPGPEAGRPEAA